jgi:branched-chain amino acid transport system substrate-binding protein
LVIQRCLELAGTLRDDALRDAANALRCRTFYGDFRLDPASGEQVGHLIVIVQWQNGAKRVVWPPDVAETEPIRARPEGGKARAERLRYGDPVAKSR